MVHRPKLWMLVGVPGSGKSTWVADQTHHTDSQEDLIVASTDAQEDLLVASTDFYIELMALEQDKTYNEVFKDSIKDAEKRMYQGIQWATARNFNIIWDQTNLTRKSRGKKLIMIPDHYMKIAVFFPTPEESELQRRLASRPGKTIPEHILGGMIEAIELPQLNEGFDMVIQND
jgi:predicted kinase